MPEARLLHALYVKAPIVIKEVCDVAAKHRGKRPNNLHRPQTRRVI
jgi:hypothetical protein